MLALVEPLDRNIVISHREHQDGQLSADNVRLGALLLHARGYVILKGAIPQSLVSELRRGFDELYEDNMRQYRAGQRQTPGELQARSKSVFWERGSRFRIFPKLTGPFASEYVLRNPFADAIIAENLGADYYCKSLSSDTCVKGSTMQAPHRDTEFYDGASASLGSIVNIPLMHCGLHNGPIEVWPGGSHLWRSELFDKFDVQPFVQDGLNPAVEFFASHLPSELIELQPGDLMIRDPGMLHRGTPNPTDEPRTMLTAAYFRGDYYYPYGDPAFNLDEQLYAELDPSVRQLFAPFFDPDDPRYARLRGEHATGRWHITEYLQ